MPPLLATLAAPPPTRGAGLPPCTPRCCALCVPLRARLRPRRYRLRNDALALSRLVCLAAGSLRAASPLMCALRSHIQGLAALRSKSGVWPLLRSRQHCLSATALIVRYSSAFLGRGFRLPRHSSARWGCRLPRAGVSNSPATRQAMACALSLRGFSLLLRRLVRAVPSRRRLTRRPARGDPRPALVRLGGPPPLLAVPAPYGRAPPGSSGLRESGARYARGFFFGYRVGGRRRRLGALNAPPRPRCQGCARSRAPLPTRPLRPLPSGSWRALRDPPAPFGRVRAAAAAPHRVRVARYEMSWVSQKNRLHYGIPAPDLRGTRFFWEPSLRHFHSRLRLHLLRSGALPP